MENNVEQMKRWLLAHNPFLREEPRREKYLEVMLTMAVAFERVTGANLGDRILLTGHGIALEGGAPVEITGEIEYILNAVNFYYGLAYERLARWNRISGYNYLLMQDEDTPGEPLSDELLTALMEDVWKGVQRGFGRSYPFASRWIYKRYGKVFLCTREATEAEVEQLAQDCRSCNYQDLFEVSWDETGRSYVC
ncbi:MAG: hypothetical protein LUE21_08965 [Oscillospiraceae bacterium]|nr:hypothetical protein [Oscillospiraceae bacterium]